MKRLTLMISSFALLATAALADPHEDREALMKSFGKSLGPVFPMMKDEKPFDASAVQAALVAFNEQAQKFDVAAFFPEGSASKRTSPKIWENMADFQARADKFKADAAAAAVAPATELAAFKTQMNGVLDNCNSCHEAYRLPED
jgi:cytochrome c556